MNRVMSKSHTNRIEIIQKFDGSIAKNVKERLEVMGQKHFQGSIMDHTEITQEGIIEKATRATPQEWNNSNRVFFLNPQRNLSGTTKGK